MPRPFRLIATALFLTAIGAPANALAVDADKDRAREVKSLQKEMAKLEKRYDKLLKRCTGDNRNRPDARACDTARVTYRDVQELKKRINTLSKS